MSNARVRILARVRAARGSETAAPEAIRAEARAIVERPEGLRPEFPQVGTIERFLERATSERLTATVDRVEAMEAVPDAVARYLADAGLAPEIAAIPSPALRTLDWRDVSLRDTIRPDEPASLALADFAVAETGSLVFHASAETPTLYNFLPLHHVVVLNEGAIVRYMEEVWPIVRRAGHFDARLVSFVTGTSGTADIEAINIRGAHGPRHLHIIMVAREQEQKEA